MTTSAVSYSDPNDRVFLFRMDAEAFELNSDKLKKSIFVFFL